MRAGDRLRFGAAITFELGPDAGLGSKPPGGTLFVTRAYRWLHNVASQAKGLGITTNIIDYYAAIIRMWEPGDRIFLFGFSRGAYTVRCLAAVLGQCGVPTTMDDGSPLRRDVGTTTRIAREAVKKVYQHVSSPKNTAYLPQREALATCFRQRRGCDAGGTANAVPFFVGVFDTVASLGSYVLSATLVGGTVVLIAALSYVQSFFLFSFLPTFLWTTGIAAVWAGMGYIATHLKYAVGLPGYSFLQTLHLAEPKMKFYDLHLNNAVWSARHAMSIDENRADFARVPWGGSRNKGPERPNEYPDWLQQVWFAGNHSDIGGSYPENEARLSDITLEWMTHAASHLPDGKTPDGFGIKLDYSYLKLHPDPLGPQHDEREPGYLGGRFKWDEGLRQIQDEAILHSSVLSRFAADGGVQHYYDRMPYRPENLRSHAQVTKYYGPEASTSNQPEIRSVLTGSGCPGEFGKPRLRKAEDSNLDMASWSPDALAYPREAAEPPSAEVHKLPQTFEFREPYRMDGVQSFREKRPFRRTIGRLYRSGVRRSHEKSLLLLGLFPASSPGENSALGKLAEGEELGSNLLRIIQRDGE